MKLSAICATAVLALGLVACGGKDAEQVKTLSKAQVKDLTAEQIEQGLEWHLEYQEKQIAKLEEAIENVEENLIESKAESFAATVAAQPEYDKEGDVAKSEAWKNNVDKIKANKQKIEALEKDLQKAIEDKSKELGFTE